ncbi:YmfQ family protein [Methylobacterium oryzisoli]|uniref:YmfQ family protein n=1 Tax=Methylobacterium oryzisoli TaxID=3385502 RepID=UPI0038915FA7
MLDRHIRRSGDDYAEAWSDLLPSGTAWPRDTDSVLKRLLRGQAQVWGDPVDSRAGDLLERETDPRATLQMLSEWERAFGLPEPCVQEPLTIEERRQALLEKMTAQGGQSRMFFYGLAARLGYVIRIQEFSPFMAGISRCGDTRQQEINGLPYRWEIGPSEIRFHWKVRVWGSRISWFRAASGRAGVDPHVRFSQAEDLECLFRRYRPAHTEIVFDYANVSPVYQVYTQFRCGVDHCGTDALLEIETFGGDPLPPEALPLY